MTTYLNIFGGDVINPAPLSYNRITLDADKTLSWPTQFQNGNNLTASQLRVTPTANGFILTFPDARQISNGEAILVYNQTANTFTINKADDTLLIAIDANSATYLMLDDNGSLGGTWLGSPFGAGSPHVTEVKATSTTSNITIAGSPITLAGELIFSLADNLLSLSQLAVPGLTVLTAGNIFASRTLLGAGNQIVINNANGVAGNPVISLDPNIAGINSISIGNLTISGNLINATNANGSVKLSPLGAGSVDIINPNVPANAAFSSLVSQSASPAENIALRLPIVAPLAGQALIVTSNVSPYPIGFATVATIIGGATLDAIPRFANVGGTLKNSQVYIDDSNNLSLGLPISPPGAINAIILGDTQQLRLGVLDGNTISTTTGRLRLQPAAGQVVSIGSDSPGESADLNFYTGKGVNFRNAANDNAVRLFASTATSTYQLFLPQTNGAINTLLYSTDGAGQLGFSVSPSTITGISRGFGRVDSAGALAAGSHNIASSVRTGAGAYQITLTTGFGNSTYTVTATPALGNRIPNIIIASATVFDVTFTDVALVAQDTEFSFACHGT